MSRAIRHNPSIKNDTGHRSGEPIEQPVLVLAQLLARQAAAEFVALSADTANIQATTPDQDIFHDE
jgi:hypothetical protein